MQLFSYVCASSSLALLQVMINFRYDCITCKGGNFYLRKDACKRLHAQFTFVTCSLSVKTSKFTCFYTASTSRRIHAMARYKARRSRVTAPAECRLTYLQFAGEFIRGVIADCLQLQVILCTVAGIFTWDSSVFACKLHVVWPVKSGYFTS